MRKPVKQPIQRGTRIEPRELILNELFSNDLLGGDQAAKKNAAARPAARKKAARAAYIEVGELRVVTNGANLRWTGKTGEARREKKLSNFVSALSRRFFLSAAHER
jgi:hypothetical protein